LSQMEHAPRAIRRHALLPAAVAAQSGWLAAWAAAEAAAFAKQVDSILYSEDALLSVNELALGGSEPATGGLGLDPVNGGLHDHGDAEFKPPNMAINAMGVLKTIAMRSR
jgi:hypothetical protein